MRLQYANHGFGLNTTDLVVVKISNIYRYSYSSSWRLTLLILPEDGHDLRVETLDFHL